MISTQGIIASFSFFITVFVGHSNAQGFLSTPTRPSSFPLSPVSYTTSGKVQTWVPWPTYNPRPMFGNVSNFVQVAPGIAALTDTGTLVPWKESEIPPPSGLSNVLQVVRGSEHGLALKSDGTVVAWGKNDTGQCDVPPGLADVVQVAAGFNHSVALKKDGTVVSWGSRRVAVPRNIANIVQVSAGYYYTVALKIDGTVVAWGSPPAGLGRFPKPTSVPRGLNDVVQVSAGEAHVLALKADGTVVGWGKNNYDQSRVPNWVEDVVQVAAGGNESYVLRNDGSFRRFGALTKMTPDNSKFYLQISHVAYGFFSGDGAAIYQDRR